MIAASVLLLATLDVAYVAPDECGDRATFVQDVRARASAHTEDRRHFDVRIVHDGDAYRASLAVTSSPEPATLRTIVTETCEQATRAMALLLALSLEGDAPTDAPQAAPALPPIPSPERPPVLLLGADTLASVPIDNRVSFALGFHLEMGRKRGWSVRASAFRSLETVVDAGTNQGAFLWTWGRLDGCPVRFGRALDLAPCLYGELGEIGAVGLNGTTSSRRSRLWGTVGALGRANLHVGEGLSVGLELGLGASLNRESFAFSPQPVVARIPAWIPWMGIVIGREWSL